MVLSWLTASNNNGRFLFSIHKTRYSAQLLAPRQGGNNDCIHKTCVEFSLSVPVQGMEEMVKDVGSVSGRSCSKFQSTNHVEQCRLGAQQPKDMCDNLSNRQRKKLKKDQINSNGILGLIPVPLGNDSSSSLEKSDLFAIRGTVAHLRCRTYAVIGPDLSADDDSNKESSNANNSTKPIIDDDHLLIMADVIDAHVHPSYWDPAKLLFRPIQKEGEQVPPYYLTFFGAQTFGYVVSSIDNR